MIKDKGFMTISYFVTNYVYPICILIGYNISYNGDIIIKIIVSTFILMYYIGNINYHRSLK